MSNNAGNISVGLVLNGADAFIGRVSKSAKSLDKYGDSVKSVESRTETWLHKTRDAAIVLGLARSAVENLSLLFTGLPRAILAQNAQLERSQVLIAGMDDSAVSYADAMERAASTVNDLVEMSSSSPFSVQAIADSFAKIEASGIQDSAEALDALINASSKSGANSEGLKRASIAIQQMSGKGVISMEELRQQLGEAIPTAMQLMADASGMRMGEMVKLISTGAMESKSALDELFKEMAFSSMGAAEAMANTLEGLKNRIGNDLIMLAKEVGDSDFNDTIKEIGNELDDMLSSGEAASAARDIGESLAYITRTLFDMSVAIAQNAKEIGAIVTSILALKAVNRVGNTLTSVWEQADKAGKKYSGNVDRYMRRTNALIERHTEAIAANQRALSERYYAQSGGAISERLADNYRKYEQHINATHNAAIEKIRSAQKAYISSSSRIIATAKNMFSAIGGWATVATVGITSLIYLYDELIGKQSRAAENIVRNNGLDTTAEEIENARAHLERVDKKLADLQKQRREQIEFVKNSGNAQWAESANSGAATSMIDSQIRRLEEERKLLVESVKSARDRLLAAALDIGESQASRLIYGQMQDITREYERQEKELRETLEGKGLKGEAFTNAFKPALQELREEAVESLEEVANKESEHIRELMSALESKSNGGILSDKDAEQMEIYKGQLNGLIKLVEKYRKNIEVGTVGTLSMSQQQMSVEEKLISKLEKTEALYSHRLSRLKGEVKYGEKRLQLEEDIAAGKYQNATIDFAAARLAADAADRAIQAYNDEKEAIAEQKRLKKEIAQVNKNLDDMTLSMAKKLGTSQGKSLNQFMRWKSASEQNAQAIAQMRKQLEEVTNMSLSDSQKSALKTLELMAEQIDLNNIILQQSEYRRDIEHTFENSIEKYNRETKETRRNLLEVKGELQQQLVSLEKNTEEWRLTKQAIESINHSLDAAEEKAKRLNPRTDGWYDLSDKITEMSFQIDNQLATSFDGIMDGFVESMWDAEASFSDVIDNMVKDIGKYITKMLIAQSVQKAVFGITGMFGGSASPSPVGDAASYGGFQVPTSNFANGGIMTEFGSLPLKKYANGGVAKSPQVAVFGEGDMNEAYVPLPDGRSIPVTMRGNGNPPVVNVINQTGVQADVQSTSRFDGEKYITDVVMKAASRPGKFRDALNR